MNTENWHKVEIARENNKILNEEKFIILNDDVKEWLKNNRTGNYRYNWYDLITEMRMARTQDEEHIPLKIIFEFENLDDALIFKLSFG